MSGLVDDGRAIQYPAIFEVGWEMPYSWSVPMDENRYYDGMELRGAFEREASVTLPDLGPCRMIEFLVALSNRMEFILFDYNYPGQVDRWFWQIMTNLRLTDIGTHNSHSTNRAIVKGTFERVLTRSYDQLGNGGLFPLRESNFDQRKVEVWYQMHAWIHENKQLNLL